MFIKLRLNVTCPNHNSHLELVPVLIPTSEWTLRKNLVFVLILGDFLLLIFSFQI